MDKEFHKSTGTRLAKRCGLRLTWARIQSLRQNRMEADAAALTAMVGERYSAARAKPAGAARPDSLEDLARPLADQNLAREHRAAIESNLRGELPGAS